MTFTPAKWLSFACLLLGLSFGHAATAQPANDYRPLIFVPGVTGSKLVDSRGNLVWGSIGETRSNFDKLAFPFKDPASDDIQATEVLDELTLLFGAVKPAIYKPISTYLKGLVGAGKYYPFAYDWRQSNFDSACDLKKFIDSKPGLKAAALEAGGINLVTHSMGGLLARVFLQYYVAPGAVVPADNPCPHSYRVGLFMPIATPHKGAGLSLQRFTDGFPTQWRILRNSQKELARVFFTLPSGYELLPTFDACCRTMVAGTANQKIDTLSEAEWLKYNWIKNQMPEYQADPGFRNFLSKTLAGTRKLREIVASPIPYSGIKVISIAGGRNKTVDRMTVGVDGEINWTDEVRGDDTVPSASSSASHNALVRLQVANTHVGIVDDKETFGIIKAILPIYGTGQPLLASSSEGIQIPDELAPFIISDLASSATEDFYVASIPGLPPFLYENQRHSLTLEVTDSNATPVGTLRVTDIKLTLTTGDGTPIAARLRKANAAGQFKLDFKAPKAPSAVKIQIELPKGPADDATKLTEVIYILPMSY